MTEEPLPKRWAVVRLSEVADVRLGRQRSPKNHTGENMRPYLRAANIGWQGLQLDDVHEMHFSPAEVDTYRLVEGDILMSEASGSIGEVGKPAIWRGQIADCCFQNTLIRVRSTSAVLPEWLEHRLRLEALLRRWGDGMARGVGIHHLGATRIADWALHLPPLKEQRRSVAELERRLSHLDAAEASLHLASAKVTAALAALAEAAITGRLVPRSSTRQTSLSFLEELVGAAVAKAGKSAWRETAAMSAVVPPPEWTATTLGQLAWHAGYGTSEKCSTDASGTAVVRIPNIRSRTVQLMDLKYMPSEKVPPDLLLAPSDVLFIRSNGSREVIGRAASAGRAVGLAFASYLIRFRLADDPLLVKWVELVASAPSPRRSLVEQSSSSAGQHNLSIPDIAGLAIPLPARSELEVIIETYEQRSSVLTAVGKAIDQQLHRCQSLRRSLLATAFAGRLVPQDPDDEPANVLLERIRAEREAATPAKAAHKKAARQAKTAKEPAA